MSQNGYVAFSIRSSANLQPSPYNQHSHFHPHMHELPFSIIPSFNSLRVNITGIPGQGAKSRVETQIKLGIQLVNQQSELVGAWTHIKLPEYMVAKEKNKRINAKNVGKDTTLA